MTRETGWGGRSGVEVWVPQLRPLARYHLPVPGGRTACGLAAPDGYGYTVPLGEALALSDRPCAVCFAPGHRPGAPPGRR